MRRRAQCGKSVVVLEKDAGNAGGEHLRDGFLQFLEPGIGEADSVTVGLRARLDRAIERALEERRIVGTVVLVAKGGDIVYSRAAGFADRTRRLPSSIPVGSWRTMPIASPSLDAWLTTIT
jgi:hypothetical protein